jgi:hypothetical protein
MSFSRRGCVRVLHHDESSTKQSFWIRLQKKGGGAPKGAPSVVRARANKCTQFAPLICLRGSGSCGSRSPSGAPQRRLPERANAPAQPRPRFTRSRGCWRNPHRRSRLSQAPGAPVVMPEESMPGPPGGGVTSPARRNRTRSIQRLSPVDVPEVSEMGRGYCHCAGEVKGFRFVPMNQDVLRSLFLLTAPSPHLILCLLTPSAQTPRA